MRMLFSQHVEGVWKRGGGGRRRQRRGPTSPFSEVPEEATIDAGSHASSSGEGMYTWAPALGSVPSAASAAIVPADAEEPSFRKVCVTSLETKRIAFRVSAAARVESNEASTKHQLLLVRSS